MTHMEVRHECPINVHLWDTQGSSPYENPKGKSPPARPAQLFLMGQYLRHGAATGMFGHANT